MTYEDVATKLNHDPMWQESPQAAREAFARQMQYRQYSRGALANAWQWYIAGYTDAKGGE